MHIAASLMTVMARPFYAAISVPANVRVRWWWVPQGGLGDRHLVTVPQEVVGDRLPHSVFLFCVPHFVVAVCHFHE